MKRDDFLRWLKSQEHLEIIEADVGQVIVRNLKLPDLGQIAFYPAFIRHLTLEKLESLKFLQDR